MTLDELALVAQVLGVVLVVPTVLYLAVQIRQNTRQMRDSASHQYLDTNKDLNLALIGNKQVASVYRRGAVDFDTLDADEKVQCFFFVGQYYQVFANMFELWSGGTLPDTTWHPIRKHLISMMALPGTRHVWDSWARSGLPSAFVSYVDALPNSGEDTYSLEAALGGPGHRQHDPA